MLVVADMEIRNLADNMSEEAFFVFCQANRTLRIERDQHGNIIIMAPTGSETRKYNSELITELNLWNRKHQLGIVFDSSTGFKLPDGSIRSPDASWVRKEQWETIDSEERKKFAPLCPDFLVELRSETDSLENLKVKMLVYLDNGCQLGWLIDRHKEQVFIYRSDGTISLVKNFERILSGETILPGFEFDLRLMK